MEGCFHYRDEGECDSFYLYKHGTTATLFILSPACPSGSFRANVDSPHCLKCPQHSMAESEGATFCTCESGHYRAPGEGPQAACTRESWCRA